MATFKKGILGGFSGLVGTVIGSTWKDQDVMKSRPKKSSKARVQSQLDQQSKFALVTKFLKLAKGVVDLGYAADTTSMSASNAAVAYHLENAILGASPNFTLNFSKVILTKGDLELASNIKVVAAAGRSLNFTWEALENLYDDDPSKQALRDTDRIRFLYYNPTLKKTLFSTVRGARSANAGTGVLSSTVIGGPCHLWIFFQSDDSKKISDSYYMGLVTGIV